MAWEAPKLNRDTLPRIDLYQERRKERQGILSQSRRDMFLTGVLFFFAVIVLVPLTQEVIVLRAELAGLRRDAAGVEKRLERVAEISAESEEKMTRWTRFQKSRDRRRAWGDVLRGLAARTPPALYLDQVQIEGKEQNLHIQMQGAAETLESLKAFTESLAHTPFFTKVRLAETGAEYTMGRRGVHFRVVARVGGVLSSADEK